MNLSSAFSNYDSYNLKHTKPAQPKLDLRLDSMITLGVFKSSSGTIKKMLHAPSLKMYAVKEVPISNVQVRQMLIDWIANWQHNCYSYGHSSPDSFIKIHSTHWNTPEGCVSVIMDYSAQGSLYNLTQSIGAIPESILKTLAGTVLRSLDFMHELGMTHSNICAS